VPGSPLNALLVEPPFDDYYFVDVDPRKVAALRELAGKRSDVHIYEGDSNSIVHNVIFPEVSYAARRRALCFLDPYGLHLDWRAIAKAAEMRSIEIFLNFPTLDMNRSVLWTDPAGVPRYQQARMTRYWGDESWRQVASGVFRWRLRPVDLSAGRFLRGRPARRKHITCCRPQL
jgi:three-Cys-motif partner protein